MHSRRNKLNARASESRKRKDEHTARSDTRFETLLLENPQIAEPNDSIVSSEKVEAFLTKNVITHTDETEGSAHVLLSNSELMQLNPKLFDSIISRFQLTSFTVSDANPTSVDRIVTVHGRSGCVSAAITFISFLLAADLNNLLKSQTFTLKSQNYKVDILIESSQTILLQFLEKEGHLDYSTYDCNSNLFVVTLKGDLMALMRTVDDVVRRFPLERYSSAKAIRLLPTINSHDHDFMFNSPDAKAEVERLKEELLKYVYSASYFESLSKES